MIIDAHAHVGRVQGSQFDESFEKNTQLLLDEMKQTGVNHALILASYRRNHKSEPDTNKSLSLVAGHPEFSVVGSIDVLEHFDEDLAALETLLKEKKIVGVKIYLGYQAFFANDPRCTPIYELCTRYGVPVIFHTGGYSEQLRCARTGQVCPSASY